MYRILIPHNMCLLISLRAWFGLFVCDMQGICGFKPSSIFNVCKRRCLALITFTPKMEKWGSREGNYLYNITQKVHDEAGKGTHLTDLLSNSLAPRENNAAVTLGRAVTSSSFCTLASVFSGDTTSWAFPHPRTTYI